tara:strand:- start:1176 stop:2099 length:924 start_codon:yes stop_codon:yes gene_type:complete
MKNNKIIIGSRGSKLALVYAERARKKILEISSEFEIEDVVIKKITTSGDLNQKDRLSDIGGKGLFSKNIETQLLENQIHIAVHALKDMPSEETDGLITNCFLERNDPREVLISRKKKKFNELDKNSIVGTSSFRREFQLKKIRNDLTYKLIRGNVDTRIKKINEKFYDAIILSLAGINSLNLKDNISQIFSVNEIIPSAGQGVVALQCKKDDNKIIKLLDKINNKKTFNCVQAERNVLKVLEGDCETAVGAISTLNDQKITLEAELFSLDGTKRFYYKKTKDINYASDLGLEVGEFLKKESKGLYKK